MCAGDGRRVRDPDAPLAPALPSRPANDLPRPRKYRKPEDRWDQNDVRDRVPRRSPSTSARRWRFVEAIGQDRIDELPALPRHHPLRAELTACRGLVGGAGHPREPREGGLDGTRSTGRAWGHLRALAGDHDGALGDTSPGTRAQASIDSAWTTRRRVATASGTSAGRRAEAGQGLDVEAWLPGEARVGSTAAAAATTAGSAAPVAATTAGAGSAAGCRPGMSKRRDRVTYAGGATLTAGVKPRPSRRAARRRGTGRRCEERRGSDRLRRGHDGAHLGVGSAAGSGRRRGRRACRSPGRGPRPSPRSAGRPGRSARRRDQGGPATADGSAAAGRRASRSGRPRASAMHWARPGRPRVRVSSRRRPVAAATAPAAAATARALGMSAWTAMPSARATSIGPAPFLVISIEEAARFGERSPVGRGGGQGRVHRAPCHRASGSTSQAEAAPGSDGGAWPAGGGLGQPAEEP